MTDTYSSDGGRKPNLPQTDVPSFPISQAIRVARAIADELGKQPSSPLHVAAAMSIKPTTGRFRTITVSSIAYGLTEGGARSDTISLTPLGRRVVAPTMDGDDAAATREAVMKPRVTREFLERYDNGKWPKPQIGRNVLEELGVPTEQSERALELVHEDAEFVGFLTPINGDEFVDLGGGGSVVSLRTTDPAVDLGDDLAKDGDATPMIESSRLPVVPAASENRRVFITHGKNREIVEQIKTILSFGNFEAVVATENHTNAKPVPDKVLDDMRSCAAGIVHVGTEQVLFDAEGNEHRVINPNVLIEIGAAMARYGRRFILLVEKGTTLPSNLQGLYEVRYEGKELDHAATMALLEAFNAFKTDSSGQAA
jgi:hypothetical protein